MEMNSKTFFKSLKETCLKIDNDVNEIKNKIIVHSGDDHEEIAAKKICDIQDQIKTLKTDSIGLKDVLEPKLAHTRDFITNLKELMAETEVSISKKEEYLKQYGYKTLELVPGINETLVDNNVTPVKKVKSVLVPTTPNLLDYGMTSCSTTSITPELNQKFLTENFLLHADLKSGKVLKSNAHSESTPTLDIKAFTSATKSEETPPIPEPLYIAAEETPPVPESVVYNSVNFPSTPKLNL